ncbi:TetR/AcrR family transcriptional regulator [Corynebacterium halotolerans]|uniref:TetR/AcrR family transcriptional regulator n=1 Tax=Corynebacterium halotolerans TaxID=225326 RepID=UPI003CF2728B
MRADARERRHRIIVAACDLLRSRHEASLTLEEVAGAAGVGIATLYRNFADRRELLHACATHLFDQVIALQDETLREFPGAPADTWGRYVRGLVGLGLGAVVPLLAPARLADLPADLQSRREAVEQRGHEIVTAAQDAGLVHPTVMPSTFIIGLITVSRPQVSAVAELAPDLTEALVQLYLSGLRHGPGTPGDPE